MKVLALHRVFILTLFLWLPVAISLVAQPLTLTITDSLVFVNGKQLSKGAYPDELVKDGFNHKLYLEETPTFNVNGQYYLVESDRIRAIAAPNDASANTTVIFRQRSVANDAVAGKEEDSDSFEGQATYYEYSTTADPVSNVMHQYVTEIGAQAQQLQQMREVTANRDASNIVQQMMLQAQEAQQIAQNMADMQFQQYLNMVQQQDQELYDRLVYEYTLERQTLALAQQARQMDDSAERNAIIERLGNMLDEIFELKQQNRREEIMQLEKQLELLQSRLQQREDMREDIVQRRIRELVGNP